MYVDPLYADDRDQVYAYDGLHRLQNVEGGTLSSGSITSRQLEQDWTLDQLGNWSTFKQRDTDTGSTWDLDQDRAHNDVNELTSFTTTTGTDWADPAYDAAGNAILIPQFIDKVEHFELIYDAWNRLVKVMNHDNDKEVQRNEYDGFNRRIVRKEYGRLVSGTGSHETRHFYYNRDWQVLVEAVEDTSSEVATAMYSYHPHYVDAVAVRIRDADAHFYLHDANYNVTAMADDTGTVVERYSYTPYGETTFMSEAFVPHTNPESGIDNEYLYTGRRLDPETGMQINRQRFLTSLGRWLTRDPIGYEARSWNLYEYVAGRPTYYVDSTGLDVDPITGEDHPLPPPWQRPPIEWPEDWKPPKPPPEWWTPKPKPEPSRPPWMDEPGLGPSWSPFDCLAGVGSGVLRKCCPKPSNPQTKPKPFQHEPWSSNDPGHIQGPPYWWGKPHLPHLPPISPN